MTLRLQANFQVMTALGLLANGTAAKKKSSPAKKHARAYVHVRRRAWRGADAISFATWRLSVDRHWGIPLFPFLILLLYLFLPFLVYRCCFRSSCISRSRPSPESYPSSKAECAVEEGQYRDSPVVGHSAFSESIFVKQHILCSKRYDRRTSSRLQPNQTTRVRKGLNPILY